MSSNKGNRLRFSKAEDEKLIHEVSVHPSLYNLNHKLYKDQNVRDNVWKIIAKNMDKSVNECKTRWKSLKDVYWKKKKDEKQGTGSSAKAINTWVHMHALQFLEATKSNRRTLSNVSLEEETDIDNSEITTEAAEDTDLEQAFTEPEGSLQGEELEDIEEDGTNTSKNSSQTQDIYTNINEGPSRKKRNISQEKKVDTNINEGPEGKKRNFVQEKVDKNIYKGPPIKKKMIGNEQLLETIKKRQTERQRIFQKMEESLATSNRNHPLKTFFASMAETVMTFPLDLILQTKKEVLDVVSRLEWEMLQRESRLSTATSRGSRTSFFTDGPLQSPPAQAFTDCNDVTQSPQAQAFADCNDMTQSPQAQAFTDCNDIIQSSQAQQYTDCADLFSRYSLK